MIFLCGIKKSKNNNFKKYFMMIFSKTWMILKFFMDFLQNTLTTHTQILLEGLFMSFYVFLCLFYVFFMSFLCLFYIKLYFLFYNLYIDI